MRRIILLTAVVLMVVPAWSLTNVDRATIWTRCWDTIRFRFTGLDSAGLVAWESQYESTLDALENAASDVEFWRELRMRIASLNDGGTLIDPPNDLPRVYDTIPIRMVLAGNKVLVKQLSQSPSVQSSGIRPGDELLTIDQQPVLGYLRSECLPHVSGSTLEARMAEAMWRIFIGIADAPANLAFRRPDGKEYNVSLERDSGTNGQYFRELLKAETRYTKRYSGGILYFGVGQRFTADAERAIIDQLNDTPPVKHLILDLRETKYGFTPERLLSELALFPLPAGDYQEVDWTTEQSLVDPTVVQPVRRIRQVEAGMIEPDSAAYRGGLIILTSPETSGPAERFIEPLMFAARATLIGDTTAGAGGEVLSIPYGSGAALRVTCRRADWQGGCGNGRGFPPRIFAETSAKSLAAGKDAVLERALEFIRESPH